MICAFPNCSIMRTKSVQAVNGVISFTDIAIIGNPGTDVFIRIEADTIDKTIIRNAHSNITTLLSDLVL